MISDRYLHLLLVVLIIDKLINPEGLEIDLPLLVREGKSILDFSSFIYALCKVQFPNDQINSFSLS